MHRIPSLRIYCTYGLKIKAQKMQIKAFLQIKSIPKSPQRSQSSLIPRFQRRCSLLNLPLIPFQTRMLHFSQKPQMKISMSYFHIKKVLSFRSRCNSKTCFLLLFFVAILSGTQYDFNITTLSHSLQLFI